jgi:thymidylate synthase
MMITQGARSPGDIGVTVSWPTCGQAWIGLMRHVLSDSAEAPDDRGPVFEGRAALFEITGFCRTDPILTEFGELAKTALYDRKFTQNAVCPPFKYSYGARLREIGGVDQLAWVTRLLAERPHSKSGWISLTLPGEQPGAVPCLTALAFRARGETLAISAVFRSQNAFTAYLNYLPLRDIQAGVAGRLGLSCGPMRVYIDVPHVYVADAPEARQILCAAPVPETDVIAYRGVPGIAH